MLASKEMGAEAEPNFRLLRSTEVTGVIRGAGRDRGRIIGLP